MQLIDIMRKNAFPLFIMLCLVIFLVAPSCKHDPVLSDIRTNPQDTTPIDTTPQPIPCDVDTAYFRNQVLSIILSNCAKSGCHDVQTHSSEVVLTDYTSIMQTGQVQPFNTNGSAIYEAMTSNEPENKMPPASEAPLSVDEINIIAKWINQGALDNHCENLDCDSINVTFSSTIWPIVQATCKGCHSGNTPGGGIQLIDYATIAAAVNGNRFLGSIEQLQGFSAMPKNGLKLSNCNIAKFKKWKHDGTPHN